MQGNVWEWTQDCYINNYEGATTNGMPRVLSTDDGDCPLRVLRGGSWLSGPQLVRSANRNWNTPDIRSYDIGFRLARTL